MAVLAAFLVLGAASLAGCAGDASTGGRRSSPKASPGGSANPVAEKIAGQLRAYGQERRARLVRDPGSELTRVEAPFLTNWAIYQVDNKAGSHPIQFTVATGPSSVLPLTANPKGFGELLRADKVRPGDTATALAVAQTYLTTTRGTGVRTYVVNSPGAIELRPGLTSDQRARALAECCSAITTPTARRRPAGGYEVTAYMVYEQELQQRTVTLAPNEDVTEKSRTLARDLPVPVSL